MAETVMTMAWVKMRCGKMIHKVKDKKMPRRRRRSKKMIKKLIRAGGRNVTPKYTDQVEKKYKFTRGPTVLSSHGAVIASVAARGTKLT